MTSSSTNPQSRRFCNISKIRLLNKKSSFRIRLMNSKEFQRRLSSLSGIPLHQLESRWRAIRESKALPRKIALPTGGRGVNAPDINLGFAVVAIISMASPTPSETPMFVADQFTAPAIDAVSEWETFGEAMISLLAEPDSCVQVDRILIASTWCGAMLFPSDEARRVGGPPRIIFESDRGIGHSRRPVLVGVELPGAVLQQIGIWLKFPSCGDGWENPHESQSHGD